MSSYCLWSLVSALKLLPIAEDRDVTPAEKHLQAVAIVLKLETVLRRSRLGAKLKRLFGKHPKVRTLRLDANSARLLAPVCDGHGVYHEMVERPNVKVSDGSQPPLTFDLSPRESAGSRSLHRLVVLSISSTHS